MIPKAGHFVAIAFEDGPPLIALVLNPVPERGATYSTVIYLPGMSAPGCVAQDGVSDENHDQIIADLGRIQIPKLTPQLKKFRYEEK